MPKSFNPSMGAAESNVARVIDVRDRRVDCLELEHAYSTARSRSASSSTMVADFPPSSSVTCLSCSYVMRHEVVPDLRRAREHDFVHARGQNLLHVAKGALEVCSIYLIAF
jgi:hypothetical protein